MPSTAALEHSTAQRVHEPARVAGAIYETLAELAPDRLSSTAGRCSGSMAMSRA